MWRWIFVNLLVFSATSTHPISEYDGRECCPCPKPGPAPDLTESLPRADFMDDCPCRSFSNKKGSLARSGGADQDLAGTTGEGALIRASDLDDCPCRLRDADSVGATSLVFPSTVRALWPVVSDKNKNEDAKLLLNPEVGLASSVLQTLREATDEEYQEALARDAVRSVLQAPDVDVMGDVSSAIDTARNIVNVILKPTDSLERVDDTESEASHVQESRCIHPLGRANSLNLQYSPTTVNDIFEKPRKEPITLLHKNRNIWDLDSSVGASDVHEQIIDGLGTGLQGLKLKSNPSLFNLFPEKNIDVSDGQLKFKSFKDNKNAFGDFKEADITESPLDALNRKIDNSISDFKLKLDNHLQSIKTDNADKLKSVLDSVHSPSTKHLAFKPFDLELTTVNPLHLKSLFNLKDVELVPPVKSSINNFNKAKSNVPELAPSNHKNEESNIDIFKNFKNVDLGGLITNGLKIGFKNSNNKGGTENIQPIPKGLFKSDIIDADTSPSEIKINVHNEKKDSKDCDSNKNTGSLIRDQSSISEAKNTEILETLPKSPKLKKLNIDHTPAVANIECKTTNAESSASNINDLPENVNVIPKTEIIDTIPSPSKQNLVEFADDNTDSNTEDSNEVSRHNAEFEMGNDEIEESDSSFVDDSMEDNREDVNDNEPNDENINDTNVPRSIEEEQSLKENCLEDAVKQQDSLPETSNNLSNIVVPEDEQHADSISSTVNNDSNETCVDEELNLDKKHETNNKFSKVNPVFRKPTLSSLKEDILNKLNTFNKKSTKKITMDRKKATDIEGDIKDNECDGIDNPVSKAVKVIESETTTSKALDIEDLQNMSDKLLDLSSKKDQETFASENVQCSSLPETNTISDQFQDPIDAKNSANSFEDTAAETTQNTDSTEDEDTVPNISNIAENSDRSDESIEPKITCASDFDQMPDHVPQGNMRNEMAADGSEPVMDKIIPDMLQKPSLLQSILHPKPLQIGSSLKGTNLELSDILSLQFPSLDNVKHNLASILEPKENIGVSIFEDENITDNSRAMSVDASAPSLQSVLPSLQPLEDINLDIFQLRPLTLPDPHDLLSHVPSLPRLNLNSYKAKLAVPKGLDLKPMKLESSLGGKNGLLGATLTIGSNKGSLGIGPKSLGGPFSLNNLPSLEELHSNMRESAQNLLLTPLDITGRNIIDDSLRSSQTLTDNLRSHAKNTMKDIQQTLQTTLKDVQQSDLSILADPLKDPQEFLQAVSRTHEDVTDKLKAIHYDLNDRLESIRDRITDQSLLPTLNAPMMGQSSLLFGSEKPPLFSPSYNKPQKKVKASKKSKPQTSSRGSSSRNKPAKSKILKMPAAHSVPVPKTVEAPKLKTVSTSSPPPFVFQDPSFRTPQLLTNKKSIAEILQDPVSRFRDSRIPVLGKFKPTEKKIKITFGSTTLRPDLSSNKPTLATRLNNRPTVPRKLTVPSKTTSPVNSGLHRFGSKLRPYSDTNEAPSEKVPAILKPPTTFEETENKPSLTIHKKPLLELPKPKTLSYKSKPHINDRFTNGHSSGPVYSVDKNVPGSERMSLADSKLGAPKNLDILASLREAVRARLSNLTPVTNDKIVQPDLGVLQPDMLRAASENVESTNVNGLMRENASYTCKMVCTRNN